MQLNGSKWKGKKVKITPAQPDFKQRHALEEKFSSYDDAEAQPKLEADEEREDHLTIKTPSGQRIIVPSNGTGSKRMIFKPVAPMQIDEWLDLDSQQPDSANYHLNDLWDQIHESTHNRRPPSPSVFLPARPSVCCFRCVLPPCSISYHPASTASCL